MKRCRSKRKESKRNFNAYKKVISEDRDDDFSSILRLEYVKINKFIKFWEDRSNISCVEEKRERVLKQLRLCKKLLDSIIMEEGDVWEITYPEMNFKSIGNGLYKLDPDPGKDDSRIKYKAKRYINKRNKDRFLPYRSCKLIDSGEASIHSLLLFDNELRLQKIRNLYHKIRFYYEQEWWD